MVPPESTPAGKPAPELHGLDPGELIARGLNTVRHSSPASPWVAPAVDELARLLPQYKIESLLGRGGMGAVYKAVHPALDRQVAIKLLPAEMAANEDFILRFQREARLLAKLQHPGIVTIFDFGRTTEEHLYFVMEYVDGADLRRIMLKARLTAEQALGIIAQICEALHAAHRQGVIHRDLKPENILITKEGVVKLADFGLARPLLEEGSLTATNMVMGTPNYMAPEQHGGQGDQRTDIFALGVMLYEMLTGQTPRGVFAPPSERVAVDQRIDAVVLKALQQEPARRYQQVSEMKTDMDRIRTTPLPQPAPPPARWGSKKTWLVALAVVAVLLVYLGLPLLILYTPVHPPKSEEASEMPKEPVPVAVTPVRSPSAVTAPAPTPSQAVPSKAPVVVQPIPARPPAATPAAVAPAKAPSLEDALLAYTWSYAGTAPNGQQYAMDLQFRADRTVLTSKPGEVWHWWITAPRTVHVQVEKAPLQFDPKSGADLTFDESFNRFDGQTSFQHKVVGARNAPVTKANMIAPASTPVAIPKTSRIAMLSQEALNVSAWITSPLETEVPDAIWENMTYLKEALRDEAAGKSAASANAYALAIRLADTMVAFLEERNQATARGGGAAVLHQKSNLTEQRRDHLTWPQYMLERDERAERQRNAAAAPRFQNGQAGVLWSGRAVQMRTTINGLYSQFREAMRQRAGGK